VKIRTQFVAWTVLFGVVLLAISVSVVQANAEIDRLDAQASRAVSIERDTSDLGYLSNEYLLHREEQQRIRWETRWSSISSDLSGLQPNSPLEAAIIERMRRSHDRLGAVFADVVRTLETGSSPAAASETLHQISWSRMAVLSQGLASDALQLTRLLNQQANEARRTNGLLITVLLGTFATFFVVNYVLVSKRALESLSDLTAGAGIIGSGDLDHTIPVKRKDEIGTLTAAFNTMAANLKGVTASKAELEREVAERAKAEAQVLRLVATEEGINQILTAALISGTEEELGVTALAVATGITQSAFGFIGEIGSDGLVHDVAMSDHGWDRCAMRDKSGHRRPAGDFEIRGLYGTVLETGLSLLSNVPSEHPSSVGTPEGHPPLTSFLGAPLIGDGQVIGLVAMANREGGYTEEDRESLTALTPAIVEAFRRKRAERTALQELEISELLLEAAHALAQRTDLDSVLEEMIRAIERASGRAQVSVGLWDERSGSLRIVAAGDDPPLPVGLVTTREALSPGIREALIARCAVAMREITGDEAGQPHAGMSRVPVELVVPTVYRDRVVGMILVGAGHEQRPLTPREIRVLEGLASQAASGIVKAQLFDAEHRIAETLQAALLIMPDSLPGVLLSHHYRSATEAAKVGGDFYDVFELEDGVLALTVGDISGKGLDAAALTALVKNTIRAKAIELGSTPLGVIGAANEVLYRNSPYEVFATVFFGTLDTRTGRLVYCNAGHTTAAMLRAAGTVEALASNSPLIGAFQGLAFAESDAALGCDDRLFMYTDGLTEARVGTARFGEERLFELLAELKHLKPADLVGQVSDRVAEISRGTLDDDLAILVVQLLCSDAIAETHPS
jgi:GAF domain-containing protein/HAMP domain-containing protein